ncbi:MAG TPA: hypothetical protein VFD70_09925 [Anaerolineae bacterium]|nr:hypothetical protein [Anaerolineae bacterium]
MTAFVRQHALIVYFVLAYAVSWTLVAVLSVSFVFALLAVFGPAVAALIVTGLTEGRAGIKELLRYVVQWRVGFVWYVIAIALPFLVSAIALAINSLRTGAPFAIASGTPIPLLLTLAFLVIGEEIGWRGFALPVCKCVQTV